MKHTFLFRVATIVGLAGSLPVLFGCDLQDGVSLPQSAETHAAEVPVSSAALPAEIAAAHAEGDWPCFRGPQRNAVSSETGLLHTFPETGPTIAWRVSLGTGFSGITVAGDHVYTLYGTGEREYVVCFSAGDGSELWKVDSDEDFAQGRSFGPRATPCIDEGRLYSVGASGHLLCLQADTGEQVWSIELVDQFGMRLHEEGLSPSPIIDHEKLIIAAGVPGATVMALNKLTGEVLWKALDEPMNHSTPNLVTLNGRRQLLVLTKENLVGVALEDGTELWRHPQRAVNIATPVLGAENHIYTGAAYGFGNQLVRVIDGSVELVYKNSVLAPHHATPVLYEGDLYGFHDRPGIMKCVDLVSGEERWATRAAGKGKLIIADGQIILINESGTLMLAPVSPEGFAPTARARILKGTCFTAPTLANGRLYVRSNEEMVCIAMKRP